MLSQLMLNNHRGFHMGEITGKNFKICVVNLNMKSTYYNHNIRVNVLIYSGTNVSIIIAY